MKKMLFLFILLILFCYYPTVGFSEILFEDDFESDTSDWTCSDGQLSKWSTGYCKSTADFGDEWKMGPGHNSNNAVYAYKNYDVIYNGVADAGTSGSTIIDNEANFGGETPNPTEILLGVADSQGQYTNIQEIKSSSQIRTLDDIVTEGESYTLYGISNSYRTESMKWLSGNNALNREIYHRWYMRMPSNFDKDIPSSCKLWRYVLRPNGYSQPSVIFLNFYGGTKINTSYITIIETTIPIFVKMAPVSSFNDGQWHSHELRIKLNTPGQIDGIVQYWLNGNMVYDNQNVNFDLTNDDTFNRFGVGMGNCSNPPWDMSEWTAIAFDDVVVSTEYIGQLPDTISPSPPENLK